MANKCANYNNWTLQHFGQIEHGPFIFDISLKAYGIFKAVKRNKVLAKYK